MLRKILCDYEFSFRGRTYKDKAVYLGDTMVPALAKKKDFTPQIVCYALKLSQEEIANLIKVHYWDLDKTKFEQAGFVFIKLKLDFYPPLDKKD